MTESMAIIDGLGILLVIPVLLIGLAAFAFWVWMLVDCLTNQGLQGTEKIVWVVVIVFTHFVGALIYLFLGRPKRNQIGLPPAAG